jgi:glycine/D-amino acid oxidase-like deaminating enzyme
MNAQDEYTKSLWMDVAMPEMPRLSAPERADVIVVGAGIAGLSVAYELAARGRSVVVIDRGGIAGGMTARTTAHLATALDDNYKELIRARSEEVARLCYHSVASAIDRADAICAAENINCDFARVDGYWVLTRDTPESHLDEEFEACRRLGIPVERCDVPTRFMWAASRARCVSRRRRAFIRRNIFPAWCRRCSGVVASSMPTAASKASSTI